MPRPRKFRRVCCLPENNSFGPSNIVPDNTNQITMMVDEYETIRLIDYEGLTQEQCSQNMGIARTTVQQIYNNARKKLSRALVEGKCLMITGGDYTLCDGDQNFCGYGCRRRRRGNLNNNGG